MHINVAYAVHSDMKRHTGVTLTWGKGSLISESTKQKVNARSSTEAELITKSTKYCGQRSSLNIKDFMLH